MDRAYIEGTLIGQRKLTDRLWVIELMLEQSSGFLAGQYQTLSTE
jgi:hypothetical protein